MKIKIVLSLLLALSPISLATAAGVQSPETRINDLAFDLYRQLPGPDQNIVFSPYSLTTLLSKLALGSQGQTRDQFNLIFKSQNNDDARAINTAFNNMDHSLPSCHGWFNCQFMKFRHLFSSGSSFESADAFWADTKFNYKQTFLNEFDDTYVSFKTVDFAHDPEKARTTINGWVEQKTDNEIKELLPPPSINNSTAFVIINALYFNGKWSLPFKPDKTNKQTFIVSNDTQGQVDMMFQEDKFAYVETDEVQMVQLDYKKSALAMAVILPKPGHTLDEVRKSLNADYFNQLLSQSQVQDIDLYLPKFDIESDFSQLQGSLISLGLKLPFQSRGADFSLMTDYPVYISTIIQKAVIHVDEQGTIAAAATAGVVMYGGLPDYPIFKANHPFIYIIFDKPSKLVMFMGQFTTPGKIENCGNHCEKVKIERTFQIEGLTPFKS